MNRHIFLVQLLLLGWTECEDCRQLGFTGLQACSDCARLAEFVKDPLLVSECESCCVGGVSGDESDTQYSGAILEVCKYRLSSLPHLKEFVKNKAKNYKFLKVRYYVGAAPKLILTSEAGKNTIRIDNWKTEHVEEYLLDKFQHLIQQC